MNRYNIVYGIGINAAGYSVRNKEEKWWCPFYKKWSAMLERCYSDSRDIKSPSYKGCSVCEEWLYFSNFKKWLESEDWEGMHIDKDLLILDNKIYSPETCCLLTAKVNTFLIDGGSSLKGGLPLGVTMHHYKHKGVIVSSRYRSRCNNPFTGKREHLGLFDCPDQAHQVWKDKKHEHACNLSELETDPRIIHALQNRYK